MHLISDTGNGNGQPHTGFEKLLRMLPEKSQDFGGTEYGQPAAMAYLGNKSDAGSICKQAEELRTSPPERMCEVAMVMAEMIEAAAPDRGKYFQADDRTRDHVFNGSKWRSGWVFLMGGGDHSELAQKFRGREFLVFAQNGADLPKVVDLGPRETAAVYFLQIMVRYAMVWGQIKPSDDHEMSHFLEQDMPGVVVAHGKLTPVEELLLLALMKMGAPAVVPNDYPWDFGRYVRAEGLEKTIEAATKFPNLRIKDIRGKLIKLPDFCNPANIRMPFEAATSVDGTGSFFLLRPGRVEDGVALPEKRDLAEGETIGIIIEIGDTRLDIATSEYLEKSALRGISAITGVRAERSEDGDFRIHLAQGAKADASIVAEALRAWILYEFPYIEKAHVTILTGKDANVARAAAEKFQTERREIIQNESDDTVEYFTYCLECQPFAKDHVCIITPDRPPMCGRDRFQVKAAALFGASWHPWKRRGLAGQQLRGAIRVGTALDTRYGEYVSVNKAVKRLSPAHIGRVQLHGLREYPHTSCGCFQFLAFWTNSLDGIGIMERDYKGEAPDGITWDKLANAAGGKQAPGITGVSGNYLRSRRFMQGEGGFAAVRWVSPKAYTALKDLLPDPGNIQIGK